MSLITIPQSGVGITVGYHTTGSVFTLLGTLGDDCEFSGFASTVINTPYLASTYVTKTPGRIDPGDFTGSLFYVPSDTGVQELQTLSASRATVSWQVMFNDGSSPTTGSTATFSGFVSTIKPGNFTGEDAPKMDFTITITGPVTFTTGT
jgi:hypothetical protein